MASSLTLSLGLLLLCTLATCANVRIYNLRGSRLQGDSWWSSDPFVKVWCDGTSVGQTDVEYDNTNPSWNEEFHCLMGSYGNLKMEVWDLDVWYHDLLGTCTTAIQPGYHTSTCNMRSAGTFTFEYHCD